MRKWLLILIIPLLTLACSNSDEPAELDENSVIIYDGAIGSWLIPLSEIRDGGPGRDGIPSIDSPKFLELNDFRSSYIRDDDLVVGMVVGDEIRAYPHLILDYHEIVNDELEGIPITLNYCPLTGTAFGWSSESDHSFSTFGVSGLLYNANLILYDRLTGSLWSQLRLQCVNGSQIGDTPTLARIVETTWAMWRTMYPNTKIMSLDTGFARDYGTYPYGPYKTNHSYFVFRATPINTALPNKLRVHAIIENDASKVYRFEGFLNGRLVRDQFQGKDFLVVGNEDLIVSFDLESDYAELEYSYAFDGGETVFTDNEGNSWNAFGRAIAGPRQGEVLKPSVSVASYWFAIAAFYPEPDIF
jgi:hypothetical protein